MVKKRTGKKVGKLPFFSRQYLTSHLHDENKGYINDYLKLSELDACLSLFAQKICLIPSVPYSLSESLAK